MKLVDYKCKECNKTFEADLDKDSPKSCPYCSSLQIYRVYGKIRIVYRGAGFYVNDSKKE